jgi:SAM-dependent methyltransferase
MTRTLDLGSGRTPKNPFNADEVYGIDIRDDIDQKIYRADLVTEPIPFEDNFFDFVTAHDFIEHVPRILYRPHRTHPFVDLMSEIFRVLKPGEDSGKFLSFTPAFPQSAAWRDPTHVNIITEETFPLYFDDKNRWATQYGFKGAFKILQQEWRGPHLVTVMKKIPSELIVSNNI